MMSLFVICSSLDINSFGTTFKDAIVDVSPNQAS